MEDYKNELKNYYSIKQEFDSYHLEDNKDINSAYIYMNEYKGVLIRNRFPIDINNNFTPIALHMEQYNERHSYLGYYYIINLLSDNIKKRKTNNFIKYIP